MASETAVVAALQHESVAGAEPENLERARALLRRAAADGVQLAVLPECGLSGYGYETGEEVAAHALELDDPLLGLLCDDCAVLGLHAVVGFIERDGERVFNSAALIADDGRILGAHRKLHLPCLGVDRFVDQGDREPEVYETSAGRVSMLICADMIFPEAARVAALKGADVVAISACVPRGISIYADKLIQVRAYENCVYVVYADMTGSDGPWSYDGRSQIAAPAGNVVAEAPGEGEHVLAAELVLAEARTKVRVRQPRGGIPHPYEVDFFGQRRPELYGALTAVEAGPFLRSQARA